MPDSARTRRRTLFGLAAAGPVALGPRRPRAALPGSATLLVPGPEDGAVALWAQRLAAGLRRAATTAINLEHSVLGGPDGVTAANRFATTAAPDGRTLLVLTGATAQARLVGDPRARFDPAGWLPLCAAVAVPIVAGRWPLASGPAVGPGAASPVRLGLPGGPEHPATAALLALDLLGVPATPVLGVSAQQAEAALLQGALDAIVLQGTDAPARLAMLRAHAWFSLDGGGGGAGGADLPAVADLAPGAPRPVMAGLRAAATGARLQAAAVLPALTPADTVALWRGAAQRWAEEEGRGAIPAAAPRPRPSPDAAIAIGALAPPPEAALAYREWLLRRLQWRPE
jgi:hypothetical protein